MGAAVGFRTIEGVAGMTTATTFAVKRTAKRASANVRDPERTRAGILTAATAEITAKGLGGARVD